ncbi:T9SS type A sorting domain-containing protein, partial [bacterium]|nr:T9SS type A sorting domain-containing protein [bacterium]
FETMAFSPAGNMMLFDPLTGVNCYDFLLNGISSQPGLADIDTDGLLDPVYAAEDKLWAYHLNAGGDEVAMSLQANFPLSLRWTDTPGEFPYAPVISRGDPVQLITGCENGDVAIFTKSGSVFNERRLSTGGAVRYAAALGQLDADDNTELAAISADNGLYVWELPYTAAFSADNWTGFLGDARHWALASSSASAADKTGDLLQTCYVYPNPAENGQTTLRFEVIEDVHYSYKIHDISGHLIQEMDGQVSGTAAIPNELEIYVIDLDSGIYFLTVEVVGNDSGNTQTRTVKLAVVR